MRRRLRIRDVLLLPLVLLVRAERRHEIRSRRARADARRRGSLTYNRQQALRRWREQDNMSDNDWS